MPQYNALYRKWRPRRLSEVVGQIHVTRTLGNALRQGKVAHAYLFCGPRGTGKTSTARILAAALNCEQPVDGDACGRCPRCREVAEDRLVDVREIDAASHRQVEDMRTLRETVGYAPAAGRHKVYILDEVHMLTDASWNTLLKTLEEPPTATTFVLCTTDPRKVLATVVSRCQRFDFRRLSWEEISGQLTMICEHEGLAFDPAGLAAIAQRVDGGMRDALSVLDQAVAFAGEHAIRETDVTALLGAADDQAADRLLAAAEHADAQAILAQIEELNAAGKDMAQVLRDLLARLRAHLARLFGEPGGSPSISWHLRAVEVLADAEGHLRWATQAQLVLEVALLRLMPQTGTESRVAVPERVVAGVGTQEPRLSANRAQAAPSAPPHHVRGDGPTLPEAWPQLLAAVRTISVPGHSLLQHAVSVSWRDGMLHLQFPSAGLARTAAERTRPLLIRAWQSLGGGDLQVAFSPGGQESGARPPREEAAPMRRLVPDPSVREPPQDEMPNGFERALKMFEGTPLS